MNPSSVEKANYTIKGQGREHCSKWRISSELTGLCPSPKVGGDRHIAKTTSNVYQGQKQEP